jgi:toxin-antitoxin system PIN domain toxin
MVLDVNVLIAADRRDHPEHLATKSWLEDLLSRTGTNVIVPDLVWVGYLRIVTNRRVFAVPTTVGEATEFVRAVCAAPGYLAAPGLPEGLAPFLALCQESRASANLITDAYIAAVARVNACPVATFDRDFRRFDGISLVVPGKAA